MTAAEYTDLPFEEVMAAFREHYPLTMSGGDDANATDREADVDRDVASR